MSWMVTNSEGKRDALLTFALWTIAVVLLKVLISGVSAAIGGKTFGAGDLDAGVIAALLTPTLGAYVARRATDRAWPAEPGVQTLTTTTERVVVATPSASVTGGDMSVDTMKVGNLEIKDDVPPKKKKGP